MKKRKMYVFYEILLTLVYFICICTAIVHIFLAFYDSFCGEMWILYINKTNISIIESYIDFGDKTPKKIKYENKYDYDEFVVYFTDNSKKNYEILKKDNCNSLTEYIENNGYMLSHYNIILAVIFGITAIVCYCISKALGNEIELQDKLEMEDKLKQM